MILFQLNVKQCGAVHGDADQGLYKLQCFSTYLNVQTASP